MVWLPGDCVSGGPECLHEAVGPLHLHGQVGGPVGGRQGLHQFPQVIIHLGPIKRHIGRFVEEKSQLQ